METQIFQAEEFKGWAVAYLRCSGRGQIDGDTWERQSEAIAAYADANRVLVSNDFRDEGISGKTELEGRSGLTALLGYLEENPTCKLVLVESSDRLARDSLVAEILIREFQKLGVKVIAASGGVDLTSGDDVNPTAKLIRQILASIAEFDRCVTVNKLRAARERIKAKEGKCEGQKSFGELPGESKALKEMKVQKALGRSAEQIAKHLTFHQYKTRAGGPWHPATVAKILSRTRNAQNLTEASQ